MKRYVAVFGWIYAAIIYFGGYFTGKPVKVEMVCWLILFLYLLLGDEK